MDESIKMPNIHFKIDYIKQIKNKNRFLYFILPIICLYRNIIRLAYNA